MCMYINDESLLRTESVLQDVASITIKFSGVGFVSIAI